METEKNTPANPGDPAPQGAPEGNEEPTGQPTDPSQETPPKEGEGGETPPALSTPPKKEEHTKRERLEYARNRIDEQLAELDEEEDESRPATIGDIIRFNKKEATETAIDMASSIEDAEERQQVIDILSNSITPSGDAKKDFNLALGAANGLKNIRVAEELNRQHTPPAHGNPPGAPGAPPEAEFVPTAEEAVFMAPPYNLTKEKIIEARQKAQEKPQETHA